jgi:hypothetical protein
MRPGLPKPSPVHELGATKDFWYSSPYAGRQGPQSPVTPNERRAGSDGPTSLVDTVGLTYLTRIDSARKRESKWSGCEAVMKSRRERLTLVACKALSPCR